MDPSYRAPTRQFVFNSDDIDAMWKAVQDPLHALQPTRIDASLDFIKLAAGAYPDERAQLLHRLKDLQKSQIPIQAYVNAFFQIEDSVHRGDDASTLAQIKRLNASIDDQEKQLAARNRPVTHTAAPTQQVMSAALTPEMIKEEKGIRFVGGQPVIASEVLKDPEVTARKFEMLFQQRPHDLACAYLKIAGVLRTGNRASEAVAFESKASQLWNRR